jgi:hypothetical protein
VVTALRPGFRLPNARIPDAATLPSAVAISAWLVTASIGLRRLAFAPANELALAPSA